MSWSIRSLATTWRRTWTPASERTTCCKNCPRWSTAEGSVKHNQHPAPTSRSPPRFVTLYLQEVKTMTHYQPWSVLKRLFFPFRFLKVRLTLSFRFIFVLYMLDFISPFSCPAHKIIWWPRSYSAGLTYFLSCLFMIIVKLFRSWKEKLK